MNVIGIRKKIDKLGRLQIPKDMRKLLGFDEYVELVVTSKGLLIKNPEARLIEKDLR